MHNKFQMVDCCHLEKNKKLSYISNGLINHTVKHTNSLNNNSCLNNDFKNLICVTAGCHFKKVNHHTSARHGGT